LARTAELQSAFARTTIQSARACRRSEALLFIIAAVRGCLLCPIVARLRACRYQYAAAKQMADLFTECGATSAIDAWSDDVPEGKVNSFRTAMRRSRGRTLCLLDQLEGPGGACCRLGEYHGGPADR
jgi:hypothetical protein